MEEENSFLGIPETELSDQEVNGNNKKRYFGIAGVAALFFIVCVYELFLPLSFDASEISFEVKKGESLQSVVGHLKKDRKSTRLNSSHSRASRMPSSA